MERSVEMLENLLKDSKTAAAAVAFHALDAKGRARFMAYLNSGFSAPATAQEPAKRRGRPPKNTIKEDSPTPKKRGRPAKANKAEKTSVSQPLPEEILQCQGKELVHKVAKFRADGKGNTTRQAVQFPLQKAGKKEAEKDTFAKIVEELKSEGRLVTDRHSWVIS